MSAADTVAAISVVGGQQPVQHIELVTPATPVSRVAVIAIPEPINAVQILIPGIPGPQGPAGSSLIDFVPYEHVATTDGEQVFTLPSVPSNFYTLYRNGLRQARGSYQVVGAQVTIPAEMLIVAEEQIAFDYIPATS